MRKGIKLYGLLNHKKCFLWWFIVFAITVYNIM